MKHNHSIRSFDGIEGFRGFTLVELMITLAISGIIVSAIYSAYTAQQRTYLAQEQVAEMQQNIRASMWIMNREVRMAGYDKGKDTDDTSCNVGATGASVAPGILAVTTGRLDFSMDLNSDGDCADTGENLSYYIYTSSDGVQELGRLDNNSAPVQAVANNFDQIEFNYLDASGNVTTQPDDIRSIQLSILARAGQPDRKFTNTMLYCPASHPIQNLTTSPPQCEDSTGATLASATWGPYNDNFRRRLLTTTVNCRNMGL